MMTVWRCFAVLALVCAGQNANAQMIDEADLRAEGADALLQVRFVTPIQFLRSSGAPRGELAQVFYDVLPARNPPRLVASERRVTAAGLPQVIVADDGVTQAGQSRKLTIRFSQTTRFRVRAGPDNRSVVVVLEGLGAALRAASTIPPLPLADAKRRYVVTIQSSGDPNVRLEAPIPASMQEFEVFSSRRVTDGRTLFDINVGYFATPQEAERARGQLLRRFAQASVVELPLLPAAAPPVATPTPARPPVVVAAPSSGAAAALASPLGLGGVAGAVPTLIAPAVPRGAAAAPVAASPVAAPGLPAAPAPAAPSAAAAVPAESAASGPIATADQVNLQAAALLRRAQADFDRADFAAAVESLNRALNLPPNPSSRRAQELIATARIRQGDMVRARIELELFLKLYPQGADSDRARQALAALPAAAAPTAVARPRPPVQPTTTLNASLAQYYFGGNSKTRTQEFLDSPLAGLPTSISENTVSGTDQSQLQSNVDVSWRHRDAERDMRFVFRDTYSYDLLRSEKSKNRLSALYFDHRSFSLGTSVRAGRQSPNTGGVLYLFDGVQGGYSFMPKWKVNGVFGVPTEKLLDSKRKFFGASVDAEALTDQISGSFYGMQQLIDGVIDRRAVGADMRFFSGGISASGQIDYDVLFKALNIAAFQGTWQFSDSTIVNTLYDKRAVSILTLGNLLFFPDPNKPLLSGPETRISDKLAYRSLAQLREQAKATTAFQQQAMLGMTTPIAKQWQWGADVRLSAVGAVPAVESVGFPGSPATGKQWSLGTQFIGSNLYSTRDSHVLSFTYLTGPTSQARLVSYNNMTAINTVWQVEPSLRFSTQSDTSGTRSQRLSPGLRVTLRPVPAVSLESDLAYERSKTETVIAGNSSTQTSDRLSYFLGLRYDF